MIPQDDAFYDTYRRMMSRVYRTTAEVIASNRAGLQVTMAAGALVSVVDAHAAGPRVLGTIKRGDCSYTGVTDDGVRLTLEFLNRGGRPDPRDLTYDGAFREMLVEEPGVAAWLPEWSAQANGQGWDIFYCDGSAGPLWQLQASNEENRFQKDEDAWEYVWNRAVETECPVAKAALAFLYYRCPDEYRGVKNHVATLKEK